MSHEEATASVVVCRTEGGVMVERQLGHGPRGKHKETASGRVHSCTSGGRSVSYIGIACTLAWAFFVNAAGGGVPGQQTSWQLSYAVLSVVVVVLGFSASKHPAVLESKRAGAAAAGVGCIASVVLAISFAMPGMDALQVLSSIACACALGWLYLQWGLFYARIGCRTAVGCLFAANIAGSVLKALGHFSPGPLEWAIAAALPIASVVLCRVALSRLESGAAAAKGPEVVFESHNIRGLWKVGAAIAAFSFVTAFLIARFSGNQSAVPAVDFLMGRVVEIAISGIVLFLVLKLNKSFNFSELWRIALLALAADMLCQAAFPQVTLLRCVESSVWDLVVLFTWLSLADIARHSTMPTPLVFGVGWACYTAPFTFGSVAASFAPMGTLDAPTALALMFVLLIVAAFCLELRDQDTKWIFAELSGERASAPVDFASLDDRCRVVGEEHGLTPRELEVMQLLVKGRTKAYIAETLYLTENTVKGHARHIYTKLDVHSKQELLDLVER